VLYLGRKGEGGYWEAELPAEPETFAVVIPAGKDESLDPYAALCGKLLDDRMELLRRCKAAFEAEFTKWKQASPPPHWEEGCFLDCITLPAAADEANEWSVCYFIAAANRYFIATFRGGALAEVIIDG